MGEGTRRRMRRLAVGAAVVGAFAAFMPLASADVTGAVTTASGQPLAGVYVKAVDAAGVGVFIDPDGKHHTPATPGRNVVFRRSGTFYLFKVLRPRKGSWSLVMTPKLLVQGTLAARVSVTVPHA